MTKKNVIKDVVDLFQFVFHYNGRFHFSLFIGFRPYYFDNWLKKIQPGGT